VCRVEVVPLAVRGVLHQAHASGPAAEQFSACWLYQVAAKSLAVSQSEMCQQQRKPTQCQLSRKHGHGVAYWRQHAMGVHSLACSGVEGGACRTCAVLDLYLREAGIETLYYAQLSAVRASIAAGRC
jgi:hypothetical protein